MKAISLRWRLLLGAAVWIGLALVALGLLMVQLFRTHVEASTELDLNASLNRLVAQIDPAGLAAFERPLSDPRYDLPYGGLYWQVEDVQRGEVIRSSSLFDFVLAPDAAADAALQTLPGPAETDLLALSRQVSIEDRPFRVTIAEDSAEIDQAIRGFASETAIALALGWLALLLAAVLQVRLGLAPLQRIRRGLEDVQAGRTETLQGFFPPEVDPLVAQVNTMLAEQRASLEFARARASDLAHGLRTPLSALQATADRLRKLGDAEEAQAVEELCEAMTDRIEYQLRLTRLRLRSDAGAASTSLARPIEQAISVLRKTSQGEVLHWEIDCPDNIEVRLDRHDLIELIGVLLENAARHARTRVRASGRRISGQAVLSVADDGPGMTPAQMKTAQSRGVRHDETGSGAGLGLAIAADIARINGGSLEVAASDLGGIEVVVTLPLAS
ncbi:HAMP domain-containing histidine kinase [Pelagibacterium sp. 26DY04]|uniref:sensor histidine kinase n=1 Tax=Pelagibacterium sp. 26DY04 TaxID=2967130 RepID=UPI00281680BA|nr:HAMP domain-containing sensor histidine kinase [Pelagibacterium sp. 26DY04]WMT87393.1 HAMP domain-containing histidine kinase [Pelagibacterium sp. 26DY04]